MPKIGRRFVKPEDICFIDQMTYPPASQSQPPYALTIESTLPLLGDRVRRAWLARSSPAVNPDGVPKLPSLAALRPCSRLHGTAAAAPEEGLR